MSHDVCHSHAGFNVLVSARSSLNQWRLVYRTKMEVEEPRNHSAMRLFVSSLDARLLPK